MNADKKEDAYRRLSAFIGGYKRLFHSYLGSFSWSKA
jgi:hypothetical protein